MTLKDSVQTAILIVGFFSLLIFGVSYYFILIDPDSSNHPLKESLSITASFFGGFATLTAAYIASKLFNDWKDTHNKNIDAQLCMRIYDFIDFANQELVIISGFVRNYSQLRVEDRPRFKNLLSDHFNRLKNLSDLTTLSLSNLGYFIDETEYNLLYVPKINELMGNLEVYSTVYQNYENNLNFTVDNNIHERLDDLMIDTRNRYRAFIVELKKYYKA
ncbi:hypothetical protein [Acinetobacter sp. WCHAc060025]|uniref:hypothetical protein n=1 Tax=Acinetobacter sp. WCHAc060025 TaxID=2518625 RepID=UPI0010238726|nr:hypothetical protein [Acinetobacter sp. WCHAc060025]RZG76656.1 hypothetical protein EXE09_06385 [Acinetobacter sp. WCHAc060025]